MKLAFTIALLCGIAQAQSKAMIGATLAAEGADAYATYQNSIRPNFQEHDPIARPLVTQGTAGLVTYFSLDAAAKIGTMYWLEHHHHAKFAKIVGFIGIGDSLSGAAFSTINQGGR